jgi:dynein heavy chain
MGEGRIGRIMRFTQLFQGLTESNYVSSFPTDSDALAIVLERYFVYSICWSLGSLLESDDRVKFDQWLRANDSRHIMPSVEENEIIYEFFIDHRTLEWKKWTSSKWQYPEGKTLNFSTLLVPTLDLTRANYIIKSIHKQQIPVLVVDAEGTAKPSTVLMYLNDQDTSTMLIKRINFSSATTPAVAQAELDKRGGENYGPPNGKKIAIYFDDVSMPEVNKWGDQPTLELIRFALEYGGFWFLDKDKRGDFKNYEDLLYLAAMQHPS